MTQEMCQALLTKYPHIMTELKKLEGTPYGLWSLSSLFVCFVDFSPCLIEKTMTHMSFSA